MRWQGEEEEKSRRGGSRAGDGQPRRMPDISWSNYCTHISDGLKLAGNAKDTVLNAGNDLGNASLDTGQRADVGDGLASLACRRSALDSF
jgi:hypothetical protein